MENIDDLKKKSTNSLIPEIRADDSIVIESSKQISNTSKLEVCSTEVDGYYHIHTSSKRCYTSRASCATPEVEDYCIIGTKMSVSSPFFDQECCTFDFHCAYN